jgi:hypothetical protein
LCNFCFIQITQIMSGNIDLFYTVCSVGESTVQTALFVSATARYAALIQTVTRGK